MRSTCVALLLVVTTASCSGPTGPTTAAITVSAPASLPARVCTRCGGTPGELEAVADLVVQETAGVAGRVTGVGVLFSNASTTIEGPGEFDPEVLSRFGVPDLRIAARGTLTMREIGVHFAGRLSDQLPATLRFTVHFRDDNDHRISSEVSVLITPP
jgi:hypothetical protein